MVDLEDGIAQFTADHNGIPNPDDPMDLSEPQLQGSKERVNTMDPGVP